MVDKTDMGVVKMDVVLVAAVAANGVIGHENEMPWHLPADLRRFKQLTMGHPIVMGRKTFLSIGKPLPGRHNIVLTRDHGWKAEGVTVVHDLASAIAAARADAGAGLDTLMVIGGGDIYRQTLKLATRLELTKIEAEPDGDTYFPPVNKDEWREVAREFHLAEEGRPAFSFVTLERTLESAVSTR